MSAQTSLRPNVPATAGEVTLFSPSLRAEVTVSDPDELAVGTRGDGARDVEFEALLAQSETIEQLTVELTDVEHRDDLVADDTRGADGQGVLAMQVPAPAQGFEQVVLDVGVDGLWTWHAGADDDDTVGRASRQRTYQLPADTGVAPAGADGVQTRGLLGKLGKRVIKVLLFRVLEEAGAHVGEKIARNWEDGHRQHRLRWVTPQNIGDPLLDVPTLSADELRGLAGKRTLLLIHGTASRTHTCFHTIDPDALTALCAHYEGRVLAFDHPTLSYDPRENVEWLAKQLPADLNATFDVISHSRGGLVARLLFERDDLGTNPSWFDSAVLVAAPNQGTQLASQDKLKFLLNALSNVVGAAPFNPIGDVLEVVLTAAKHVVVGAFGGLSGLASMDPGKDWPAANLPDATAHLGRYKAIGSNFEPAPGSPLVRLARDFATDALFGQAGNDLVVPTDGTDIGGQITPSLRVPTAGAVDHSGYWRKDGEAIAQLRTWIGV
jgi:hypothetical protein